MLFNKLRLHTLHFSGKAKLPLLILLVVCLAGCATVYNPATGRNEVVFISTSSEVNIGKSAASQISQKYKLSENQRDLDRLNRIGNHVAQASDRKDLEYKFYIIEDDKLNAFTIPGGHIYFFKGLYDILDEDEIACVIAHEIGHVAARHTVKRLEAALGYQVISTIALAAYASGKEDRQKRASYIAYAGATAFNVASLGYSRKDEFEADSLAVKYAIASNFDPRGMIGALKKLDENKKKGLPVPYMLRSHPYTQDRIARIEELVNVH